MSDPAEIARRYATSLRALADAADDYADDPAEETWQRLADKQRRWGRDVEELMRSRARNPLIPVLMPAFPRAR